MNSLRSFPLGTLVRIKDTIVWLHRCDYVGLVIQAEVFDGCNSVHVQWSNESAWYDADELETVA